MVAGTAHASQKTGIEDLARLSLEELAEVEIISVSKRPESIKQAPSAIYVINPEDIRRSGATSLPEVLRLAPNLQVQKLNSVDYAISARGFNGFLTANKLLVLVDGRSIYEPMHAGVFWDARLQMLHDIERIEVISGPGGALHGANAINGVINIITKTAQETQGGYIEAGVGEEDQLVGARYGGDLGAGGAWRAYVQGVVRDGSQAARPGDIDDRMSGLLAGFRTDLPLSDGTVTFQGDIFKNDVPLNYDVDGGNLMGRWSRQLASGGSVQVAGYLDRSRRSAGQEVETENTYDLHAQRNFAGYGRHQVVLGGGYRVVDSVFRAAPAAIQKLDPVARDVTLADVFAQDQIALRDDLTLTLGFRYEDSSLSGDEYMPSIRLAWRRDDALVWGAVSRAVRTSTRLESDLVQPGFFVGGNFASENVVAYELGYRANFGALADISVSAFYNDYDDLRTAELANGRTPPLHFANGAEGHTYGVEAWGNLDLNPRWRLSAGLATLRKFFHTHPGVVDLFNLAVIGEDPEYQATLRSSADLTDRLELDISLRAVDDLMPSGLDGYVDADLRLGWRVNDKVELSLTGSNLSGDDRYESDYPTRARTIGRNLFASIRMAY